MKTSLARREFITRSLQGAGVFALRSALFESVVAEIFGKAFAAPAASLNPSGYYLNMSFPGAPPRWLFDLPLTPGGQTSANFKAGSFGTVIGTVGGQPQAVYEVSKFTASGKTLYLPPVWGMSLGQQKFTDLLPHMLFARGMDMEINNHLLGGKRQAAPILGGFSLNGVVADRATRAIPSIGDSVAPATQSFKSVKGYATQTINYSENATVNPVGTLLSSLKEYRAGRAVHTETNKGLQNQAFERFDQYAAQHGITASALTKMYDNAIELIDENTYKLSEQWSATVAKYRAIVTEALQSRAGVTPFAAKVPVSAINQFRFNNGASDFLTLSDARDMITSSTVIPRMAENFAIAEILLDKVTATMTLSFPNMNGLSTGKGTLNMTHDQHFTGSVVATLVDTLFYRAFLGCLTEFVAVLKSRGVFERTVIHLAAEFNRSPRTDSLGADHAPQGSNATLISGMLTAPAVVGNIKLDGLGATYNGTFGVSNDYALGGLNRAIQVNDIARTVSSMLGVDDIVTNGRSLLVPSGGRWVPVKEEANNG